MGKIQALAGAVAMLCAYGIARAAPADDVRKLLDAGQAQEAYELGRKQPELLGQPAFDFAFGLAAINSGHATEGILALERVLLAYPDNGAARLELARGYFLIGEDARAREEFEAALAQKPAPDVRRVIDEYLDEIRYREFRYQPTIRLYVELGGGHDSNVQAGVANPVINLPYFGEVTVAEAGVQKGDQFAEIGIAGRASIPVTSRLGFFVAGAAEARQNRHVSEFDTDNYAGAAGATWSQDQQVFRLGVSSAYQRLDRQPYRKTTGLGGDWAWRADERNLLALGLQHARFNYTPSQAVRDADFDGVSAIWRHLFPGTWRPELDFTASYGQEKILQADRQDLSRTLAGGRIGFNLVPGADWLVTVALFYQGSNYHDPDPTLLTIREDRYASADVLLAYALTRKLQLRLEFSGARNDSNLELYEYNRRVTQMRLRYEFR